MGNVKWNTEQRNAIDARNTSLIVSAAAGSGKTAVLVQRLLELLSDQANGVSADRIAVVTFTTDAAAQMKHRLNAALGEAIEKDPNNLWLTRQQNLINSAKISTIHTFCFDLIKDNTALLDISGGFRIMDEADEKILILKAVDNVFENIYADPETAPVMNRLVEFFSTGERRDSDVENVLLKIYEFLMSVPFPEDWFKNAELNYSETDPFKNIYTSSWISDTIFQLEKCVSHQRNCLDDLKDLCSRDSDLASLKTVSGALKDIKDTKAQIEAAIALLKDSTKSWDERINVSITSPGRKRSYTRSAEFTSINNIHRRYLQKAMDVTADTELFKTANLQRDFKIIRDVLSDLHILVSALIKEVAQLKAEKNALSFSDAEQLTIQLLCRRDENGILEKTPLAQELSEHYKVVMIDEFQDANENQNLIFRLLSHNGTPEQNGDNLFVVGDVKQSIYSFRLANPAIFRRAFLDAEDYSDSGESTNSRIVFNSNYRSSRDVIDFTNYVFENIMTDEVGGVDYTGGEKLVQKAEYPDKDRSTVLLIKEMSPSDTMSDDEAEADAVAAQIASMIGSEEITDSGVQRKCRADDFCILLRDNRRGQIYSDALARYGISGICEETSGYIEAPEIALMINFLRIIDNPMCDIPIASVLMSPIFMVTADELAQLRLTAKGAIYGCVRAYLDQHSNAPTELWNKLSYFSSTLDALRMNASSADLETLIRLIYDSTDYLSSVQAYSNGVRKRANLRQLLVYAAGYQESYDGGLPGFIRYLDDIYDSGKDLHGASVNIADQSVLIKTIHKSKGLEYPFVFLCGTAKKFSKKSESDTCLINNEMGIAFTIQDHAGLYKYKPVPYLMLRNVIHKDQLSEEMRLMYVAMTRAKEQLFISAADIPGSKAKTAFHNRMELLVEMADTEKCITPDIVSEAESMRDWLMITIGVHPDYRTDENEFRIATSSKLKTCIVKSGTADAKADETTERQAPSEETVKMLTERFRAADDVTFKEVAAKFTITEIAKDKSEMTLELPKFSQSYSGLTAAQAGTAMHTFMQYVDFSAAEKGIEHVAAEADRLTAMGLLSVPERKVLDTARLYKFFTSDLYARIKKADEICREKKFLVKISELSLDDELSKEYNNNDSMLQGIADCFFVENGEIVLIDYKTDRVSSDSELADRYTLQLKLYSAAFEKIRRLKVKEAYLYSFALGRKVPVDLG